jgi:hypothetical protein
MTPLALKPLLPTRFTGLFAATLLTLTLNGALLWVFAQSAPGQVLQPSFVQPSYLSLQTVTVIGQRI